MCFAASLSSVSPTGGHPTGVTALASVFRISPTASPSRKICTSCPASASASPCRKGNAALVGSSEPHALFIMILSGLRVACPPSKRPAEAKGNAANCANRDRNSRRTISSDPRVPGVPTRRLDGAPTIANMFQRIGDGNTRQELHALVPQLPRHAHTQRSAMVRIEIRAIHPIRQKGLRMIRIRHVQAVPHVIKAIEHHVLRLRAHSHQIQNMRKRDPRPPTDKRPALFARLVRNLTPRRHALQLIQSERSRQSLKPPANSRSYASVFGGRPLTGTTFETSLRLNSRAIE